MFEITPEAITQLKAYMESNKVDSALRISLMNGGCSGMSLALSLDELKDGDKVFEESELKFLIEEALLNQCEAIKLDYMDQGGNAGFALSSKIPVGGGGGCSSGSCGSGGCGS